MRSVASVTSTSPWPAPPTLAAEDANVPLVDRVRARGGQHVAPVTIAATKSEPERMLVFLGNDAALHAMWVATAGASPPVAVEMPRAIHVLGTVAREEKVYVWVESLAALDQPAGMRKVLVIDTRAGKWADSRPSPSSLADLEKQLSPRPAVQPLPTASATAPSKKVAPPKKPPPTAPSAKAPTTKPQKKPLAADDPFEALIAADKSTQALAKAMPKAGAEIVRTFQNVFEQRVGKVDAASLATSPQR